MSHSPGQGRLPAQLPRYLRLGRHPPDEGAPVRIEGDPDHPYTRGWLCTKVNRYLEFVLHPDRLRRPLRRVGRKGEGRFEPISWDEALDEIATRWQALIAEHGAESILPVQLLRHAGRGAVRRRQHPLLDAHGRQPARADHLLGGGHRGAAAHRRRLLRHRSGGRRPLRLILLWGTNPASTHPHFIPLLDEARRRGARVVLIDPHRTLTANRADLHLQPRPGSDAALALAMMHVLFAEDWVDDAWAEAHTVGLDALRERVQEYPPERAAPITGLHAAADPRPGPGLRLRDARPDPCSMGLQRHTNGGNTIRAPGLPAGARRLTTARRAAACCTARAATSPGRRRAICPASDRPARPAAARDQHEPDRRGAARSADPPVRSLYVFNSNPAAVAPARRQVRAGLEREDLFTVVHELFLTDTALYADILLPATSQFEHWDLHKAYGHLYLSLNRPVMPPLGEAKTNWEVFQLLAARWATRSPSSSRAPRRSSGTCCSAGGPGGGGDHVGAAAGAGHRPAELPGRPMVPFADGKFPTPQRQGRAVLRAVGGSGHGSAPRLGAGARRAATGRRSGRAASPANWSAPPATTS